MLRTCFHLCEACLARLAEWIRLIPGYFDLHGFFALLCDIHWFKSAQSADRAVTPVPTGSFISPVFGSDPAVFSRPVPEGNNRECTCRANIFTTELIIANPPWPLNKKIYLLFQIKDHKYPKSLLLWTIILKNFWISNVFMCLSNIFTCSYFWTNYIVIMR
jgi:hypothetical protein